MLAILPDSIYWKYHITCTDLEGGGGLQFITIYFIMIQLGILTFKQMDKIGKFSNAYNEIGYDFSV